MTDKKEVKPKQSGMALEMDVIKKIGHQLGRVPASSAERIVAFVRDWAGYRTMTGDAPKEDGQLPLASNGKQSDLFE